MNNAREYIKWLLKVKEELGVQDPIGFWDRLGLSADKDEATFKRRREVEIKHGHIVRGILQVPGIPFSISWIEV